MSKGRKQMLAASIVLVIILAFYFGAKEYSDQTEKKQQEEEATEIVRVTDFEIADVAAFSYASADLEVSFKLDGETWKNTADASLEIDTEKIESFLENFNAIESDNQITDAENMSDFGLDEAMSSITFEFVDGESLTCTVGEYNDVMSVYYFKTNESDNIYTVDGTVANKLSNTVDNFVVEEEEEEAGETTETEEETEIIETEETSE